MATQEILVRYKAEVDQLTLELKKIVDAQERVTQSAIEGNAQVKKNLTAQEFAAKKRIELIKLEEKELAKLRQLRKLAFDPKTIADFDKRISESVKNIQLLRSKTEQGFQGIGDKISTIGKSIALSIGAAFSAAAIANFGKTAINAFLEAEESANRLRFAIVQIGHETEAVFNRLIEQSARLQRTTIFSDESVQQAQTVLATFGLTGAQIEELLPKLADFASITRQDITSAAESVGRALQGNGRDFKRFGIEVSATATEMANLTEITKGFVQFQGAAAKETETLTGQLKQEHNQVNELEEDVGERLAPAWVKLKKVVLEATLVTIDYFTQGGFLATSLLNRLTEHLPDAFESVTKRVEEQTKKLIEVGFDEQTARKAAISDIRAEINQRLALAIAKAQAVAADKDVDVIEKQRVANRLTGIRNELNAVIQLADQFNELKRVNDELLRAEDLKIKKTQELNDLLKINLADNRIVGQSNVRLIQAELDARKKADEEAKKKQDERIAGSAEEIKNIKLIDAQYRDFLQLLEDTDKTQLIELEILFRTDPEAFKQKVAELVKQQNIDITVPLTLTVDPTHAVAEMNDGIDEITDNALKAFLDSNEKIINSALDVISQLQAVYADYSESRITQINNERDAKLQAIDAEQAAIDEQLSKRRISESQAEKLTEELTAKRLATEETAARKERALKKKQFEIDRIAAIIEIGIATARAIAEMLTIPPPAGPILAAFVGAAGLAQEAIVAAQPNPYKKGTKGSKAGMALVGEEGPEMMMLPQGAKVLTAPKTKTYGEALDAMMDNRFDKYVMQKYSAPLLEKQRKQYETKRSTEFAENITKSMVINNMGSGLSDHLLGKIAKGTPVTNIDQFAKVLASELQKDPYR